MATVPPRDDKDAIVEEASVPVSSISSQALDDSYDVYKKTYDLQVTPEEAKKVLRKVDMRLLPILTLTYMLQYLDKGSINFASVFGLEEGTNLKGQDYSWLAGYALQRLPIGKFIGSVTLMWGGILMTTPACKNFAGMAANRFMLGLTEAVVNPGFVLIMGIWYTVDEQPFRLEIYYCMNGIGTMFGGLMGYAVGHINTGLQKWMYVFIIFGSISFAVGIASLIFLPDLPSTAKFLSEREQIVAVDRVAGNRQGVKNHHFKPYQAWQAVKDPKTWMLFIMAVGAQVPNSALTSFASIIVKSFGFDTLGTQYLQIPGGAVQFAGNLLGGFLVSKYAGRYHARSIAMILANSICIIGAGLLVGLPSENKWGRMVALWLCYFQSLGFSLSLTIVSSNIAGYTKKQVTGAMLFTGYCVGNILGPQTFKKSEAPGYKSAYIAMLVGYTVKVLAITALYIYMYLENKRRDREALTLAEDSRDAIDDGMMDKTELENKGFRYVL
ncbi:hypothetical protein FQN52_006101 [Onygenales sp. PD_12]|nr:hypothetical protein FQN53_004267 [Emmonsiellopsis sp. PD_33]KAK2795175.1 hypothetical protein FQN52_006101 [Onygenales sp. PD_12]